MSHEPVKYYKGKLNTCAKVSPLHAPFFPTANQLLQHWEVKYIVVIPVRTAVQIRTSCLKAFFNLFISKSWMSR